MSANGADALRKLRAKLDKHCAVSEDAMMVVIIDDEMQDMRNLLDAYLADPAKDALVKALEGVIRVADRATDEFDAARAALAKAGANN